jgi:GNAT superfamily N-acetyltransferase
VKVLVERAVASDSTEILRLRREAEDWLAAQGIVQWGHGEVTLAGIAKQVSDGEWYVVRRQGQLGGALRLLWSDRSLWPDDGQSAAYVHGMMIDRTQAGHGLGASMLAWAHGQALAAGAGFLRLDCVESNQRLRDYYAGQGFTVVGRHDFEGPWSSVILLQTSTSVIRSPACAL